MPCIRAPRLHNEKYGVSAPLAADPRTTLRRHPPVPESPKPADLKSEQDFFDTLAAADAPKRFSQEARNRYLNPDGRRMQTSDHCHYLLRDCAGLRICDFGCGQGHHSVLAALRGAHVFGFDVSIGSIRYARRLAQLNDVSDRAHFALMDAHHAAFPDNSFDAVHCNAIFHHVRIPDALAEVKRIAKPGALIVMYEPVALCPVLRALRWIAPVKRNATPGERQLDARDLKTIFDEFPGCEMTTFRLFGRLDRLLEVGPVERLPIAAKIRQAIRRVDRLLMDVLPFTRSLAGLVVIAARNPGKDTQPQPAP